MRGLECVLAPHCSSCCCSICGLAARMPSRGRGASRAAASCRGHCHCLRRLQTSRRPCVEVAFCLYCYSLYLCLAFTQPSGWAGRAPCSRVGSFQVILKYRINGFSSTATRGGQRPACENTAAPRASRIHECAVFKPLLPMQQSGARRRVRGQRVAAARVAASAATDAANRSRRLGGRRNSARAVARASPTPRGCAGGYI